MPTVSRFNVAHVKGLGLQHPAEIDLTVDGVAEDRRFYLVEESGRLIDQLTAASLVQVGGWTDPEGTVLRLTFPDGRVVEGEVRTGEPIVTAMYGRTVHGRVVEGPWAEALGEFLGRAVRVGRTDRPGGTREVHQATVVGDGSLAELGRRLGTAAPDGRRFRMLIELEGTAPHEEDTWVGGRIQVGEAILGISAPTPRCAMPTHDPDSGQRDLDILRAIKDYRGLREGRNLDFGVWAEIERPGRIRLGDAVAVA